MITASRSRGQGRILRSRRISSSWTLELALYLSSHLARRHSNPCGPRTAGALRSRPHGAAEEFSRKWRQDRGGSSSSVCFQMTFVLLSSRFAIARRTVALSFRGQLHGSTAQVTSVAHE